MQQFGANAPDPIFQRIHSPEERFQKLSAMPLSRESASSNRCDDYLWKHVKEKDQGIGTWMHWLLLRKTANYLFNASIKSRAESHQHPIWIMPECQMSPSKIFDAAKNQNPWMNSRDQNPVCSISVHCIFSPGISVQLLSNSLHEGSVKLQHFLVNPGKWFSQLSAISP